ncbi:hypothetical protein WG66_001464 [Moniliophthora roreri]|uniref:NADH:flavin oxidoreductase/NADH oxidase N-terminal domain-containing protein n=1 Tax=Moniliophthora roreri TaxID=221103 RepID=A0A0W0FB64_MONRR|nr:hypothetical protein WG66_001464 [Moniliophthora roreri]
MSSHNLFQPIKLGAVELKHRVVLAPLTRMRGDSALVPQLPIAEEYYVQRGSAPGTLLISEGTAIKPQAASFPNGPGIWSDEQIAAWKKITDAVHAKGSYIFIQLFASGRVASPSILASLSTELVGPSAIPNTGQDTPRPLTVDEIHEYVQWFAKAASDSVHKAGFDGVELHLANGYLLNQFLSDTANHRTDEYGGNIENRARFPLEVVGAVVKAVGEEHVGARVSPWNTRMDDPIPQHAYVVREIRERYPNFAYLSVIEPRISGSEVLDKPVASSDSNDFLREIWKPKPLISAGGYTRESAIQQAEKHTNELIAFGRQFISNPDLIRRLQEDLPSTKYDRSTFYTNDAKGYVDYPFYEDQKQGNGSAH